MIEIKIVLCRWEYAVNSGIPWGWKNDMDKGGKWAKRFYFTSNSQVRIARASWVDPFPM